MFLFKTVFKKDIIYLRRYYINTIFSILLLIILMGIAIYGYKYINPNSDNSLSLISGYIIWIFMSSIVSNIATKITNEANLGTLEQLYINSKNFYATIIMQSISVVVVNLCQMILFIIVAILVQFIPFSIGINFLKSIPILCIGLPSLWGVGLILASLSLRYKNINSISSAVITIFFAIISYYSVANYNWSFILIPFATASNYAYSVICGTPHIGFNIVMLVEIAINSFIYFTIGIIFFKIYEYFSKKNATFGTH